MEPSIRCFKDIHRFCESGKMRPLVLFSGGLDGAYLIQQLFERKDVTQVIALTVELGGGGDSQNAKVIATQLGATFVMLDRREEFAREFVIPALKANSRYLNQHPISASLSRPFLARCALEIAKKYKCNMILHSATTAQNSLRRFTGAMKGLGYKGIYGSPYVLSRITRAQKLEHLQQNGVSLLNKKRFSTDANFWCREFESGSLDDVENLQIPDTEFTWSQPRHLGKKASELITLGFQKGIPISIDDKKFDFLSLVSELNTRVGRYGIGRFLALEEIEDGVKFPEMREMPAATILLEASRFLETAILDTETIRQKMLIEQIWVREAIEGRWFFPLKKACDAFIDTLSERVTGSITFKLDIGTFSLASMKVNKPRYGQSREIHEEKLFDELTNLLEKVQSN